MKNIICGDLKNANKIDTDGMFFGNHSTLIYNEIDYLIDHIKFYIERNICI